MKRVLWLIWESLDLQSKLLNDQQSATVLLRKLAADSGFQLYGIADSTIEMTHLKEFRSWIKDDLYGPLEWFPKHQKLREQPQELLDGCKSILMVGLVYDAIQELPQQGIKISRYAMGRDYHRVIRKKLKSIAREFSSVFEDVNWRICVDSAPLAERYWGWRAGLGWIGRNCMLINQTYGSWFFLGALLLDKKLETDRLKPFRCGNCTLCLDSCPTKAFVKEGALDAGKCISAQTIELRHKADGKAIEFADKFSKMPQGWLFGCDTCQECCPWNKNTQTDFDPEFAADEWILDRLHKQDWPQSDTSEENISEFWDRLTRGKALRRMSKTMFERNLQAARVTK
jgi:epoxyqueuosine reductase